MSAAPRKVGTPTQEAMHAFAEQVAKHYRETLDAEMAIDAHLIQDDTVIAVSAVFANSDREAWVPLNIGQEGWNETRRARLVHEFGHVARKRLELEKFTEDFVAGKLRAVIDAYR